MHWCPFPCDRFLADVSPYWPRVQLDSNPTHRFVGLVAILLLVRCLFHACLQAARHRRDAARILSPLLRERHHSLFSGLIAASASQQLVSNCPQRAIDRRQGTYQDGLFVQTPIIMGDILTRYVKHMTAAVKDFGSSSYQYSFDLLDCHGMPLQD